MFVTDAWAIKYAKAVIQRYKDSSILYEIDVPGPKYSHAIYTSYMTGKMHTNYAGKTIVGDNLLKSMKRSTQNFKLKYIGPEWSFLAILGKKNYDKYFDNILIVEEPLNIHYEHPYPFFFEDKKKKDNFDSILKDLVKTGGSLITHSAVFDHRNHGEKKFLGPNAIEFPGIDKMAQTLQSDMVTLKKFIDKNPDYLLILLSVKKIYFLFYLLFSFLFIFILFVIQLFSFI